MRKTFPFPKDDVAVLEQIRDDLRRKYNKDYCVWLGEDQMKILKEEIQKERERNQTFVALDLDGRRMRVWKTPGISLPEGEVVEAVAPSDALIEPDKISGLFDVTPRPLAYQVAMQQLEVTGEFPHPLPFDVDVAIETLVSNNYRLAKYEEIPGPYQDSDIVVYVRDANPGV